LLVEAGPGKRRINPGGSFLCPAQPPGHIAPWRCGGPIETAWSRVLGPASSSHRAGRGHTNLAPCRRLRMAGLRAGHGVWVKGQGRSLLAPRGCRDNAQTCGGVVARRPPTGAVRLGQGHRLTRPVYAPWRARHYAPWRARHLG
jgi:hypothetical protein